MKKSKQPPELQANLKIQYIEDPILFDQLTRIILLALELSDKSKEEAETIQKQMLDKL